MYYDLPLEKEYYDKVMQHQNKINLVIDGRAKIQYLINDMRKVGFKPIFMHVKVFNIDMKTLDQIMVDIYNLNDNYVPKYPLDFKASIENAHKEFDIQIIIKH